MAEPGCVWYAQDALDALPGRIDMLVVDGPPSNLPGMDLGRAPALEALAPRLSHGAMVALDDMHRPGEQAVARRWEEAAAFRFRRRDGGRIAVASGP
jgi:hypothetical protein